MIKDIDVLAREWADPHVANDAELGRLLGVGWERVVVLGDSIAAGVREPSPGYRDLSWSDRLAAGLALARPGGVVRNGGWHAPLRSHPAASDADIFARDGLHLNARGHAIVGTELARCLGAARGGDG